MAVDAHLSGHGKVVFNTRIKVRGGEFGPRHQPGAVLKTIFLPEMIDYAFMVVRHPVARLISEYRYQNRHNALQRLRLKLMGFDLWLKYSLMRTARTPGYRSSHFRPQVDYECFDCETFRYEDGLDAVMERIGRTTGIPIAMKPRSVNPSRPIPVHVPQTSLDRIAQHYAADFMRFGYDVLLPDIAGVTGPARS